MRRIADFLARPIAAAFLASFATALLFGAKPPEQHFTERVVERVEVPGSREVIYRTIRVCAASTNLKALNEVGGSSARSGAASVGHSADSQVGGSARASGDNAAASNQVGVARSGLVNLGQITDVRNACGNVTMNLENTVTDSEARSGDASVENDADLGVGGGPLPASSPTPSPEPVQEEETADESPPPSVRTVPPPTGPPSPSSTLAP